MSRVLEPGEVVDLMRLVSAGGRLDAHEFARRLCAIVDERTGHAVAMPGVYGDFAPALRMTTAQRNRVLDDVVPAKPQRAALLKPGQSVEYTLP